jgi:hypothetical protein
VAVTAQKFAHTPLAGSGLSIPSANKQREFATWVEAKEVRNTQFTDWLGSPGPAFELNDIEVGASYNSFIATTLGAQAGASDEQLTVASTALLRAGDQIRIKEFYTGSTTEYDDSRTERATILTVDDTTHITVERAEGEVADGSYLVHPSASVITVVSRAQNYNEPFPDAITFRGDSLTVHTQRFDSGEITYDLAAVSVPDFEAPNGHYMNDVMYWKETLPYYRNDAFINGRKRTGNYLATPKIPYRLSGAIWWAEQYGTSVVPINGMLNYFDFSDVWEDMATNHKDGAGDTIWMHPRMVTIWNEMLLQFKGQFGANDTSLNMTTKSVKSAFGTVDNLKWDTQWPMSKILITSKADWMWSNKEGMNWTYVERGPEELGTFGKSWTMGGDFGLVCRNISHQRLLTGIDTRVNLYPGRSNFL